MSGIFTDAEIDLLYQQSSKRFDFSGSLSDGTVHPNEVYRKAIEWITTSKAIQPMQRHSSTAQ
ncbi:hypothetical protein ASF69_01525 [Rhizobium sp. Leaf311]|uniref:hypothetical protein n=1 Tax=Rhizobium sp. Leaf311 TaxID=1736332 RepID=UPI000713D18E|nr:hypothetical protein [Rhizobium sp. Leaf311]KQQ61130.1 hypothetical protein ASF69_01525 [Rhizobium sp. Leaf311]